MGELESQRCGVAVAHRGAPRYHNGALSRRLSNSLNRSPLLWSGTSGATAFLGRLANQVTVLREGGERRLLGYLSPGLERHSLLRVYLSRLWPGKRFHFTTTTNGSARNMVPLGQYERVIPLNILPTPLLRSLVAGNLQKARALGALELVEEDLALCTYVCVCKHEFGPILRHNLTRLEGQD